MADKTVETMPVTEHESAMQAARAEYDEATNLRQAQINELTADNERLRQQVGECEGKLVAQAASAANAADAAAQEHQAALQGVVNDTNERLQALSGQFHDKLTQMTQRAQAEIQQRDATIGELSQQMATLKAELGRQQALVAAQQKCLNLQTDEAARRELWRVQLIAEQAALDAKRAELAALPPIQ